jgi:hypothetical protein
MPIAFKGKVFSKSQSNPRTRRTTAPQIKINLTMPATKLPEALTFSFISLARFLICLLGCVIVWVVWKEHRDKLQEKRQSNQGKSNHAAMSPQPSAMCRSVTETNPGLVKLVGGAPGICESKTSSKKTGNNRSDSDFPVHKASIMVIASCPDRCHAKKRGVTYSRSATGTGMPSWNAFRHARWGVPSALSMISKLPVLLRTAAEATQILCFGFLVGVLTDVAIEPPKPGGFKRGFLASLAEEMPLFGGAFYGLKKFRMNALFMDTENPVFMERINSAFYGVRKLPRPSPAHFLLPHPSLLIGWRRPPSHSCEKHRGAVHQLVN